MDVCPKCFEYESLRDRIESEGVDGDCPTCGTKGTKIIDASELSELFEQLSRYYTVAEPGEHYVYDPEDDRVMFGDEGEPLDQLLQEEWPIFTEDVDPDDIVKVLEEVWPGYDSSSNYTSKDLWYVSPDKEFQSLAEQMMHERRFFPKDRKEAPDAVSIDELLGRRLNEYARPLKQAEWFRGRRHETAMFHVIPDPFAISDMGAPPKERLWLGGRANPAGISYLYLGSSAETVIAEVRAIPGDYVSVGTFVASADLMVVHLAAKPPPLDPFGCEALQWGIERRALLRELGRRLSQPVRDGEHELQYVVTQYLAEFIASKGYAGIIYPSALSKGQNLVLFDPTQAKCTKVEQCEVRKLDLKYESRVVSDFEREHPRYV